MYLSSFLLFPYSLILGTHSSRKLVFGGLYCRLPGVTQDVNSVMMRAYLIRRDRFFGRKSKLKYFWKFKAEVCSIVLCGLGQYLNQTTPGQILPTVLPLDFPNGSFISWRRTLNCLLKTVNNCAATPIILFLYYIRE